MTQATSRLHALITNDPEHPAICIFIQTVETTLTLPCEDKNKVEILKKAIKALENILAIG